MNNIENKKFSSLNENDLENIEGGLIITTGGLIGLGLAATGFGLGYYYGRK